MPQALNIFFFFWIWLAFHDCACELQVMELGLKSCKTKTVKDRNGIDLFCFEWCIFVTL